MLPRLAFLTGTGAGAPTRSALTSPPKRTRPIGRPEVRVRTVESRSDLRRFVGLPYALHGKDPNWVAPLRLEERRRWSTGHNPALRDRRVTAFLAYRGRRLVGRVAAIVDAAFAARWGATCGFFGFFECEDDPEAARAMLAAAESKLRRHGVETVLGPVNLTTHDEVGVLVEGFEAAHTLLSPHNPPYYAALIEAAGFAPARDYHAYLWTPEVGVPRVAERLARVGRCRHGRVTTRPVDASRWEHEAQILWSLYNAAFEEVWGFVPIGWKDFRRRAATFVRFYRPELIRIAEVGGAPAGFALILPDVNEALARLGGRLLPLGWLRLARDLRNIRTGRLILLGVRPEYVGDGLSVMLGCELISAVRRLGFERVEISLVDEDNAGIRRVIDAFGLPRTRVFRLFGKTAGRSGPVRTAAGGPAGGSRCDAEFDLLLRRRVGAARGADSSAAAGAASPVRYPRGRRG
jgi:GNAT superfamily N-acetyltransferase